MYLHNLFNIYIYIYNMYIIYYYVYIIYIYIYIHDNYITVAIIITPFFVHHPSPVGVPRFPGPAPAARKVAT